jgi:hypothetical protein
MALNYDFVRGTATGALGTQFYVNARSGPSGEDATGHFYVERKDPLQGCPRSTSGEK